ncbi:ABC transporter permease [Halalkalibacillus sediminis]|uniref:ABC transporter permease n=1 Tax=Halalkalibacillus sediminis TaxID=2018042 RepID=A0A2I0QSM7_9BACI|nr:ABC transporter permease [Halalkalibacillus sediminis]PKR77308.1 ABC transporter permease [Halalkalibacillus sediminis]
MRNSLKVAKWEMRRNMKNKSFIISLFLTPIIFIIFATVPTLLSNMGDDDADARTVYLNDELGVYESVEPVIEQEEFVNWNVIETDEDMAAMQDRLENEEEAVFILLNEQTLEEGNVQVLLGEEVNEGFVNDARFFEQPLRQLQLQRAGLSEEETQVVASPLNFETTKASVQPDDEEVASNDGLPSSPMDFMEQAIPGIFAGIVLFSIVITGMMIFQSASQEKKDKVAEIILSSVTPGELMQGKIIGYFGLGITQVAVWLGFAVPIAMWQLDDVPVLEYLLVPETLLLVAIAILGYLLFASLFVGIGATLEDATTSGNFQSVVLMLPFIPFILIGPILSDPSGIVAQVASFIPFTAPGALLIRLSMLEEWPWLEVGIAIAILLVSIWIFMKLAGKIFKIGILIYGKNATPQEIWKWLRA